MEQYLHVLLAVVIVIVTLREQLKDDGSTATTVQQTTVVVTARAPCAKSARLARRYTLLYGTGIARSFVRQLPNTSLIQCRN